MIRRIKVEGAEQLRYQRRLTCMWRATGNPRVPLARVWMIGEPRQRAADDGAFALPACA